MVYALPWSATEVPLQRFISDYANSTVEPSRRDRFHGLRCRRLARRSSQSRRGSSTCKFLPSQPSNCQPSDRLGRGSKSSQSRRGSSTCKFCPLNRPTVNRQIASDDITLSSNEHTETQGVKKRVSTRSLFPIYLEDVTWAHPPNVRCQKDELQFLFYFFFFHIKKIDPEKQITPEQ